MFKTIRLVTLALLLNPGIGFSREVPIIVGMPDGRVFNLAIIGKIGHWTSIGLSRLSWHDGKVKKISEDNELSLTGHVVFGTSDRLVRDLDAKMPAVSVINYEVVTKTESYKYQGERYYKYKTRKVAVVWEGRFKGVTRWYGVLFSPSGVVDGRVLCNEEPSVNWQPTFIKGRLSQLSGVKVSMNCGDGRPVMRYFKTKGYRFR